MEETKKCPYCGEEILAVAKKCRYCGEWLEEHHGAINTRPQKQNETYPEVQDPQVKLETDLSLQQSTTQERTSDIKNNTPQPETKQRTTVVTYQRRLDSITRKWRDNRKKYKEEYLKIYNQHNGDIPCDMLPELRKFRESLYISLEEANYIVDRIKNPLIAVRKTDDNESTEIKLDASGLKAEATMLGAQYAELIDQLAEFDEYVTNVIEMSAQISEKCSIVCKNVTEVGTMIAQYGFSQIKKGKSGGTTITGVGAAVAAAAGLYQMYQEHKIKEKEKARLQIILEKKQEYANVNLKPVTKQLENAMARDKKMSQLYQQTLHKGIDWETSTRYKELKIFEISFWLQIKQRYLIQVLQFLLCEMQAWLSGEQESDAEKPSFKNTLDNEVMNWAKDLLGGTFDEDRWDGYLEHVMTTPQKTYQPSVCMLFCNSYLFRNYVGCDLWDLNDNGEAFTNGFIVKEIAFEAHEKVGITFSEEDRKALKPCTPINDMLEHNAYYQECKEKTIAKAKLPYAFGVLDFFMLFMLFWLYLIVMYVIAIICCTINVIAGIIIYGALCYFLVYKLSQKLISWIPCIRKNRKYINNLMFNETFDEMKIAEKYNTIKL